MTYVQPSGPQSIGGVIDDAIRLYRASFRRCRVFAFAIGAAVAVCWVAILVSLPDVAASAEQDSLRKLSEIVIVASLIFVVALHDFKVRREGGDLATTNSLGDGAC